jgi:hypothetical protein
VKPRTDITSSSKEVKTKFVVTDAMNREYWNWRKNPRRQRVVALVSKHTTQVLYKLTPDDVAKVCENTEHPLGNIQKTKVESIRQARDWNPSFAFTHLFHYFLERKGFLPYWQHFYNFLFYEEEGRSLFGREVSAQKKLILKGGRVGKDLAGEALKWRIGLACYSFLREVYSVVALRARGVDARVHPLADALFRTDAWVDNIIISMWVSNEVYRSKGAGRKKRVNDLLNGANPLCYLDIPLDRATEFGRVHLPSDEAITQAVSLIEATAAGGVDQ